LISDFSDFSDFELIYFLIEFGKKKKKKSINLDIQIIIISCNFLKKVQKKSKKKDAQNQIKKVWQKEKRKDVETKGMPAVNDILFRHI